MIVLRIDCHLVAMMLLTNSTIPPEESHLSLERAFGLSNVAFWLDWKSNMKLAYLGFPGKSPLNRCIFVCVAGRPTTSGEAARCTVDTTVISHIPALATVAARKPPSCPEQTVTVDLQIAEDDRRRGRGDVHAPPNVDLGPMITTAPLADVAHQNETETEIGILGVTQVIGRPIGARTVTMKSPDVAAATASNAAIDHSRENVATRTVAVAIAHTHVKIANLGQRKIVRRHHLFQTVADPCLRNQTVRLSKIFRRNWSALRNRDQLKSRMAVAMTNELWICFCVTLLLSLFPYFQK